MPETRKPSNRRQRRGTQDVAILHDGPLLAVPKPPRTLSRTGKRWYAAFWLMDAARAADPTTDGPIVSRWATYMAEWETVNKTIQKEGTLATGSMGQTVQHPLFRQRDELEGRLSALEMRLGLDPKSRAQLGISINVYKKTAAQMMEDIINMPAVPLEEDEDTTIPRPLN